MDELPSAFRPVAELIREEAAVAICRVYGGVECYVPKYPRPGMGLVELIGMEAATKMAGAYGGMKINPPMLGKTGKKKAIALATGSLTEVARRFGVTRAWVWRVRNGRN